jgi:D-hexose-6-phosphate mutarotase
MTLQIENLNGNVYNCLNEEQNKQAEEKLITQIENLIIQKEKKDIVIKDEKIFRRGKIQRMV